MRMASPTKLGGGFEYFFKCFTSIWGRFPFLTNIFQVLKPSSRISGKYFWEKMIGIYLPFRKKSNGTFKKKVCFRWFSHFHSWCYVSWREGRFNDYFNLYLHIRNTEIHIWYLVWSDHLQYDYQNNWTFRHGLQICRYSMMYSKVLGRSSGGFSRNLFDHLVMNIPWM